MPTRYKAGDVIKHAEMSLEEGMMLQRGMNFRSGNRAHSIILMSVRPNAPYADRVEDDGRTLIYEGHNIPRARNGPNPNQVSQPLKTPGGRLTQNGRFSAAAAAYREGGSPAELVRVYEKVRGGIWVYNGVFRLVDAWTEKSGPRRVFKFRLELANDEAEVGTSVAQAADHPRVIPASVKQAVWKRDKGRCVQCGADKNLHFDHIIPWSKGGSSLTADNIQLLCASCNLKKHDRIE
jgi:hypothetical protein